jgi:DNA-binding Lrp family transcriptional regulator
MTIPKWPKLDAKILAALQRSGRMTNQSLSALVGLSPRPCLERVRRLENAGIIHHYMAILDLSPMPELVAAFAEISLKNQGTQALRNFEAYMAECPEVVECYLVGGEFDYLAHVVCPTLDRYNALTTEWIDDPTLHVARMVSNFVIKPVRHFAGYPLPGVSSRNGR